MNQYIECNEIGMSPPCHSPCLHVILAKYQELAAGGKGRYVEDIDI